MATITASGVGSGLDINAIISQLMAAEQQPLTNIDAKAQKIDARAFRPTENQQRLVESAFCSESAQYSDNDRCLYRHLSDTTLGTATASTSAAAGAYT